MSISVIIPAGGKGLRLGGNIPKQYRKVLGKDIIVYTLEIFEANDSVNDIIIACEADYFYKLNSIIKKYKFRKNYKLVEGGNERQDSVFNAISSLNCNKNDLVIVHDAARPLLSNSILTSAIKSAKKFGNAVVGIKSKDTLIEVSDEKTAFLNRNNIYQIQTPQIFKYEIIKDAYLEAYKSGFYGTDDSMLVMRLGHKINYVEGSIRNFKITTSEDLILFKELINAASSLS